MHQGADRSLEVHVLSLQFSHEIFHPKSNSFMCVGQLFAVIPDTSQMFPSIVFAPPKGPLARVSLPTNKKLQKQLTDRDQ